MRQIRFRFDGQPINEADTPAQVWQPQALVGHLSVRGGLLLGGSVFKFRDSLFQMGRKPLRDILPRVGRCGAWAGAGAQAAGQCKSGPGPGPAGADPGRGHGPGPRHSWARQPHDPEPPTVGVFLAFPRDVSVPPPTCGTLQPPRQRWALRVPWGGRLSSCLSPWPHPGGVCSVVAAGPAYLCPCLRWFRSRSCLQHIGL